MPIDPLPLISGAQSPLRLMSAAAKPEPANIAQAGGPDFGDGPSDGFGRIISDALQQVDQLQQQANEASALVATGQSTDLHAALLRVEEAGLAMQLALQVRNKLVESYQEIMRMPV